MGTGMMLWDWDHRKWSQIWLLIAGFPWFSWQRTGCTLTDYPLQPLGDYHSRTGKKKQTNSLLLPIPLLATKSPRFLTLPIRLQEKHGFASTSCMERITNYPTINQKLENGANSKISCYESGLRKPLLLGSYLTTVPMVFWHVLLVSDPHGFVWE